VFMRICDGSALPGGEPQRFEITWRGVEIEIRYRPPFVQFYLKDPLAHPEVMSIESKGAPLPIAKTGYTSRFMPGVQIEAEGRPCCLCGGMA
jgi:hypothetical protein